MKQIRWLSCIVYMLCLCLGGCGRFIEWGKCQFNQGCRLPSSLCCVDEYVRTVRVYNEFHTMGMFDALWLAPAVREAAIELRAMKFAMSEHEKQVALAQAEAEAEKYIDFYVLAFMPRPMGEIFDKDTAVWAMTLAVDGVKYAPIEVKHIFVDDVDQVWKFFLGDRLYSRRKIYKVRFDNQLPDGTPLMKESTKVMTMCLRMVDRQAALAWQLCAPNALSTEPLGLPGCNESGCEACGACQECTPSGPCCEKKDGI